MAEPEIVVFLDANGNEVSNDPRWIAEQVRYSFEDTVDSPERDDASGVGAKALDDMDAKELKKELKRRNEAGREIDTEGVKNKADLLSALKADDEAQAQEALAGAAGAGDPDPDE